MSSSDISRRGAPLPPIDERLAPPETRFEVLDGELVYVSPADPPHGMRHSKISALVELHAGAEFDVASDMLTRTSKTSDVAPDVSVFPDAPDPVTGGRQLEQLAFEVVSQQSLAYAGRKAARLAARGVRRVFAIDVQRARALEWSVTEAAWVALHPDGTIEDPALAVPIPIAALLTAGKADDVVARALIAKRNPEIEAFGSGQRARGKREGLAKGKREGLAEGKALGRIEAVLKLLAARGLSPSRAEKARIRRERDLDRLGRWLARAVTCTTIAELFAEP